MDSARRVGRLIGLGAVAALVLSACTGADDDNQAGEDGDAQDEDGGAQDEDGGAQETGFEDCIDNPNECNTGEAQQGGEIIWVVSEIGSGWNTNRSDTNTVYSAQAVHGILPEIAYNQPDGSPASGTVLAEPPELLGEDPFSWQYQIREDAVWSDGEPISADDFILGWKMLTADGFGHCIGCDPNSVARSQQIESIEASEDGKTVTVTLAEGQRNPEWQFVLFDPWPAHIAEAEGFITGEPDEWDPAGVGEASVWFNETTPTWSGGPWMIVEGDMENQVIKEPNPMWYGEPVNLEQIIIRFIPEESTWPQAMQNGEIDGSSPSAAGWPEDVIRQLQDLENVNVGIAPGAGFEHVDMNLENEQLAELPLRQAMFTALDRDAMAQRLYGELFPQITTSDNYFLRSFQPGFVDTVSGTGYGEGNLEEARAILEDAGYTGFTEGETLTLDGEQIGPFRLRATGTSVRQESLQLMQEAWSQLGIETQLEPIEDLGGVLGAGDYDIVEFGWSGSPTFTELPEQMLHSESESNFGHYINAEVDELVLAAKNAASLEEAAEMVSEAAQIAVEEAYVLPLYEVPNYLFAEDQYVNIRDNVLSGYRAHYHNYAGWGLAATAE